MKHLTFVDCRIRAKHVEFILDKNKQLQCLHIEDDVIFLVLVKHLLKSSIKTLHLIKVGLEDKHLKEIASMKYLKFLIIDDNNCTSVGLNCLLKSKSIEKLWARKNYIGDANMEGEGNLTLPALLNNMALKILCLNDNKGNLSLDDCSAISKCFSINTLVLNNCNLTTKHLNALLCENKTLRTLYVHNNRYLSNSNSMTILANNKYLQRLFISIKTLCNRHILKLLSNKNLRELNMDYSHITNKCITNLIKNKTLVSFSCFRTSIDQEGISQIVKGCDNLKRITYSFNKGDKKKKTWYRDFL